jgi:hypothetical protein
MNIPSVFVRSQATGESNRNPCFYGYHKKSLDHLPAFSLIQVSVLQTGAK